MTNKINGIDISEYFINHYDNSGKLYAVEYKGNPLELQNAIKHLQKENEELKKRQITKNGFICDCEQNEKYKEQLQPLKRELKKVKEHNEKLIRRSATIENVVKTGLTSLQTNEKTECLENLVSLHTGSCMFFRSNRNCRCMGNLCSNIADCYFKQFIRL